MLFHFSEDPTIERFEPHVPATNPDHAPAVWAIDAAHAPLYWFPRHCPRVTAWARSERRRDAFRAAFTTPADRVHAVELGWLERIRSVQLFVYVFDDNGFEPWPAAAGQWIAHRTVLPSAVQPMGDLLDAHAAARIELRLVPSLWPMHDFAAFDEGARTVWDFSIVRMNHARPR